MCATPWGCAAMTSTFYYIHLVLHCQQCYLWMWHISSQCNVFGNTLKLEHAMNTRNTTCILNYCVCEYYIDLVCLFLSVVVLCG